MLGNHRGRNKHTLEALRMLAALTVLGWVTVQSSAFDARAPMITEAQRDATN